MGHEKSRTKIRRQVATKLQKRIQQKMDSLDLIDALQRFRVGATKDPWDLLRWQMAYAAAEADFDGGKARDLAWIYYDGVKPFKRLRPIDVIEDYIESADDEPNNSQEFEDEVYQMIEDAFMEMVNP